jgi:hypothetical protein
MFLALGLSPTEAAARSALLYAYVFCFSMMQCSRFDMDMDKTKDWIAGRIIR